MPIVLPPLNQWETFYVIVGSSAAALTGLQFVVIALSAGTSQIGGEAELNAFATPTVVHFCAILTISALLSTPGQTATSLGLCLSIAGLLGLAYALLIAYRTRRTTGYKPVFEDWLWHVGLPLVVYLCLLIAGITMRRHPTPSLYVIAATALMLLFIGIHNAWDAAVYISLKKTPQTREPAEKGNPDQPEI
jgi:hypothetical protein